MLLYKLIMSEILKKKLNSMNNKINIKNNLITKVIKVVKNVEIKKKN